MKLVKLTQKILLKYAQEPGIENVLKANIDDMINKLLLFKTLNQTYNTLLDQEKTTGKVKVIDTFTEKARDRNNWYGKFDKQVSEIITQAKIAYDSLVQQKAYLSKNKDVGTALIKRFIGALNSPLKSNEFHGDTCWQIIVSIVQDSDVYISKAKEFVPALPDMLNSFLYSI